jgi:hypothetical protein
LLVSYIRKYTNWEQSFVRYATKNSQAARSFGRGTVPSLQVRVSVSQVDFSNMVRDSFFRKWEYLALPVRVYQIFCTLIWCSRLQPAISWSTEPHMQHLSYSNGITVPWRPRRRLYRPKSNKSESGMIYVCATAVPKKPAPPVRCRRLNDPSGLRATTAFR